MPRRRGLWAGMAAGCTVLATTSPPPARAGEGPVVAIHDHGRRVRFEGEQAETLARLCEDLLRRSTDGGGAVNTSYIRDLRELEVVVEVRLPEEKEFPLTWRERPAKGQYLLVPLTGEETGLSGDYAHVYLGQHAEQDPNAPIHQFFQLNNPRDEYHIQYMGTFYTPDALGPLRAAVTALGFDAPQPTPRTPGKPRPPRPFPVE